MAPNQPHEVTAALLAPPLCIERGCRHVTGIISVGSPEADFITDAGHRWACLAFPDGIPNDIAYRDNLHIEPDPRQAPGTEDIVFESLPEADDGT